MGNEKNISSYTFLTIKQRDTLLRSLEDKLGFSKKQGEDLRERYFQFSN